jgi:hypothetical protein
MNRHAGGLRRILSPPVGVLVSAVGVVLLTAACSASANSTDAGTSPSSITSSTSSTTGTSSPSASSGTSSTSAGSGTYQKAVAYAQCMRQHGVPNFPDPLPNGGFGLSSSVTGGTNGQVSPQYQAATNDCASLSPTGSLSPQRQEKALSQLLKVSTCMRSHGYKNFPDPTFSSDGIELHIVGFDRNSPQFQSAWQTCQTQAGTGSSQG